MAFQPMPLSRRPAPFDHPEYLFELKYDGFRALAVIQSGRCQLISRNGHPFNSFDSLRKSLTLPYDGKTVIDGEIVCLDDGTALFQRVCEMDLEGIVAKHSFGNYVTEHERTTWFKIKNRNYSQMAGREKLFERERHREPVPGWHSCALACAESG
jgi:ATP-dependent DNA ligase